ncbi:MAG: hypothetical protein OXC40_06585, partial [Proteobacteria bacterium]|nr:hypothetical protein [Pseudomonadota bacterium]
PVIEREDEYQLIQKITDYLARKTKLDLSSVTAYDVRQASATHLARDPHQQEFLWLMDQIEHARYTQNPGVNQDGKGKIIDGAGWQKIKNWISDWS